MTPCGLFVLITILYFGTNALRRIMLPEELLYNISLGNEAALQQLYELFKLKVYNTCLAYLQSEAEAEEVLQDIFVEIYQSAGTFKGNASVSTWIYRIAVNKCLDRVRYNKRRKRFAFISSIFPGQTEQAVTELKTFDHPGIKLENKEEAAYLFKAIKALPQNQQLAFILRHVEGLSQKEIAAILNIGEKAVESLLQRAKGKLRKLLSNYFNEYRRKQ